MNANSPMLKNKWLSEHLKDVILEMWTYTPLARNKNRSLLVLLMEKGKYHDAVALYNILWMKYWHEVTRFSEFMKEM